MILYIENPNDATRKLPGFIDEFVKVARYKSNIQKSVTFLDTKNEVSEKEIKETIPFTIRKQRSNCQHPLDHQKSKRLPEKIYFCFIDYAKAFDCVDHNKLWKILKEMGIPDHLTYLLRNLYTGKEARIRTGHKTTDWLQIWQGVH